MRCSLELIAGFSLNFKDRKVLASVTHWCFLLSVVFAKETINYSRLDSPLSWRGGQIEAAVDKTSQRLSDLFCDPFTLIFPCSNKAFLLLPFLHFLIWFLWFCYKWTHIWWKMRTPVDLPKVAQRVTRRPRPRTCISNYSFYLKRVARSFYWLWHHLCKYHMGGQATYVFSVVLFPL